MEKYAINSGSSGGSELPDAASGVHFLRYLKLSGDSAFSDVGD